MEPSFYLAMQIGYRDRRRKLPEFVPEAEQVNSVRWQDFSPLQLGARLLHAYGEPNTDALAVFTEPDNALEYLKCHTPDGIESTAVVEVTQAEIQRWCFRGNPSGLCILDPEQPWYKDDVAIAVGSLNEWAMALGELR